MTRRVAPKNLLTIPALPAYNNGTTTDRLSSQWPRIVTRLRYGGSPVQVRRSPAAVWLGRFRCVRSRARMPACDASQGTLREKGGDGAHGPQVFSRRQGNASRFHTTPTIRNRSDGFFVPALTGMHA